MVFGDAGHVLVEMRREVRTYAEVWHASWSMLRIAEEHGKGQTWLLMASVVFTAFAFEAYLNHVGPRVDPAWGRKQDFLPVRKKFDHLSGLLGVTWAEGWAAEPLVTVDAVIGFRNAMAHARSETLEPPPTLHPVDNNPLDDLSYRPLAAWEARLRDDRFAQAARASVEAVLSRLHEARADEDKEPLFMMGMTVGSGSFVAAGGVAPAPD